MSDRDGLVKAVEYVYRLLKYRERSEKEVRDKLKAKGYPADVCTEVITRFTEMGYIDDRRFANVAAENIVKFRPGSLAFIYSALLSKGVSSAIADTVISGMKDSYNEYEIAYKIAVDRSNRSSGIEREKAKQRVYNFLMRRRFDRETITEVLRAIYKD